MLPELAESTLVVADILLVGVVGDFCDYVCMTVLLTTASRKEGPSDPIAPS